MRGNREIVRVPPGHSFRVLRWHRNLHEVWMVLGPDEAVRIPGQGRHWHYHTEMELALIDTGAGTRFVGDHVGRFAAEDIVFLGEHLPHYWHAPGTSSGIILQWSFPPDHPFWAHPEMRALVPLFQQASRGIHYSGKTAPALAAGIREIPRVYGVERLSLFFRLLSILSAAPESDRVYLASRRFSLSHTTAQYQQMMGEAVRFVLANFRGPIHLEEVLRLTGMGKTTFTEQFKKHSGKTFIDFVVRTRLEAASRRLTESERPVLEIALECGFADASFFSRIFRRTYGCSPSEYRLHERAATRAAPKPRRPG